MLARKVTYVGQASDIRQPGKLHTSARPVTYVGKDKTRFVVTTFQHSRNEQKLLNLPALEPPLLSL